MSKVMAVIFAISLTSHAFNKVVEHKNYAIRLKIVNFNDFFYTFSFVYPFSSYNKINTSTFQCFLFFLQNV